MNKEQQKRALLEIIQDYAPDEDAKETAAQFLVDLEQDWVTNSTKKDIIGHLASALADGLNYGNWPWTHYSVMEIKNV